MFPTHSQYNHYYCCFGSCIFFHFGSSFLFQICLLLNRVSYSMCRPPQWLSGKEWQPTPVFLPGKTHGQRGLGNYSSWGHKSQHNRVTVRQKQQLRASICVLLFISLNTSSEFFFLSFLKNKPDLIIPLSEIFVNLFL